MKKFGLPVAAVVAFAVTGAFAYAHGGATGIVKERMDGMVAMGKALTVVGDMFKGKTEFDPALIKDSAIVVGEHALAIEALFPDTEESRTGKGTEALPAIWDKSDDFIALANELKLRAYELAVLADTGDKRQIRTGFAKLSKTCSSCHTGYRKPKH